MGLSEVDKKLIERLMNIQNGKKRDYVRWHRWGKDGETKSSTFRMLLGKGEEFLKEIYIHRYLRYFKDPSSSLFPLSEIGEAVCLGSAQGGPNANVCPMCAAVEAMYNRARALEEAHEAIQAKEIRDAANRARAKAWTVWTAITRSDEEEDQIELYRLQSFYANKSLVNLLTIGRKKYTERQWKKNHKEDLLNMTDEERRAHWLLNCATKLALPYDLKKGWDITVSKSGSFATGVQFNATFEEESPIVAESGDLKLIKTLKATKKYPSLLEAIKLFDEKTILTKIGAPNTNLVGKLEDTEPQPEGIEQPEPEGIEGVSEDLVGDEFLTDSSETETEPQETGADIETNSDVDFSDTDDVPF